VVLRATEGCEQENSIAAVGDDATDLRCRSTPSPAALAVSDTLMFLVSSVRWKIKLVKFFYGTL